MNEMKWLEQAQRIREAEHRFCEAIDLKVDPDNWDGEKCTSCIVGQLLITDHLAKVVGETEQDTILVRFDAPSFDEYCQSRREGIDRWIAYHQYVLEFGMGTSRDMCQAVADFYHVDFDKVEAIYLQVADGPAARNLNIAKHAVVAAHMDCDFGPVPDNIRAQVENYGPEGEFLGSHYDEGDEEDEEDEQPY